MNFHMPTDEEMHAAFAQGEAAVLAVFHAVATQVAALAQQLAQQGAVLQEVQGRLAKSSHNSSTPPWSDGDGPVKRTASVRKVGAKPNSGQPGHEGQTRLAVEHPERPVTYVVPICAHCHASLQGIEAMGYAERQVCELPAMRIAVPAHRGEIKVCPACGKPSNGSFPATVTQAVQYGLTGQAWAAYVTNDHHIPVERTTEIFADLVPHHLSDATVLKASEHLETCIAPSTEAVQGLWRTAEVLPVEESGLRVRGKLHGLHVASPERLTAYEVQAQRGHEAMEAMGMLGPFRGTVVHDHWQPYLTDDECAHALCKAHHLRELRCIDTQAHQAWANDRAALLVESKAAVEATPAPAMRLSPPALLAFETRDDAIVQAGFEATPAPVPTAEGAAKKRGRPQQAPPGNLRIRLRDVKGQVVACMADCRVPFENNQGERDIRMVQVKQKGSGGFRTLEGAQRFGRIRGDLSTARKHAKNVFEAIQDALEGQPFIPSPDMQ